MRIKRSLKKKLSIAAGVIFVLFIAYTLIGFLLLPSLIRSYIHDELEPALQRDITVGAIRTNPYTLTVRIEKFVVKDGGGVMASIEQMYANLSAQTVYRRAAVLKELRITQPYFKIIRYEQNKFNFSDIAKKGGGKESDTTSRLPLFSLNNILITGGTIDFLDELYGIRHKLSRLELHIPFVSNLEAKIDVWVKPLLAGRFNESHFRFEGQTKPFSPSRETALVIDLSNLEIPYYASYFSPLLNFAVISGTLAGTANINFSRPPETNPAVRLDFKLTVKDFAANDSSGNKLAAFSELAVTCPEYRPLENMAHISSLVLQEPSLRITRDAKGILNIDDLMAQRKGNGKMALRLDRASIAKGRMTYENLALKNAPPLAFNEINLSVANLDTAKPAESTFEAGAQTSDKGSIQLKGEFNIGPFLAEAWMPNSAIADFSIAVKNIGIAVYQEFMPADILVLMKSGRLHADGSASVRTSAGRNSFVAGYAGSATISNFSSIHTRHNRPLVNWRRMQMRGIEASTEGVINIKNVNLDRLVLHVNLDAQRSVNIFNLYRKRDANDGQASSEARTIDAFKIAVTELSKSSVDFQDFGVEPRFSFSISNIQGTIEGISSKSSATVDLSGRQEQGAPIRISGAIGPLYDERIALDLSLIAQDLDMTKLNPYARKYIGYSIQKGDMNLTLKYDIVKDRLEGINNLILQSFSLGGKVSDVTNLPIPFIISILRGPDGDIQLTIPVQGQLSDPAFDFGDIIRNAFRRFFSAIVTSPFRFLGSIFGIRNAETIKYLEFAPASAELTKPDGEKLNDLSTIMKNRPSLEASIYGYVDLQQDAAALRTIRIKEALMKIDGSEEEITQGSERYYNALHELARRLSPQTDIEKMTYPEVEAFVSSSFTITEDDLESLARARSEAVLDYMVKKGGINREKLVIADPLSLEPVEEAPGVGKSRVDFNLR